MNRRTIDKTEIVRQWIEQGELYIRYTATWSDGIVDTWVGRVSFQSQYHVRQEKADLKPRELTVIGG